MTEHENLKVFITAGEESGDALGASLMQHLKTMSDTRIAFTGVGGQRMEAEGLSSLFPMRELSVMGLAEVLPKIPHILKRINQTANMARDVQPDIFVTIDSPDFSKRVAKKLMGDLPEHCLKVHYVSPTVWAWRPERAAKLAELYDLVLCLYDFEPPYYKDLDIDAVFVGHSMLDSGVEAIDGNALRAELGIPVYEPVLGLLFGSRMSELNRTGPILHDAAKIVAQNVKGLHVVSLTLPHLQKQAQNLLESLKCKTHLITDTSQKWGLFKTMDAAIAVSGTVGLELAAADTAHVIGYKMNPITWALVQRKLTTEYAHIGNIIEGDDVVPEYIQKKCRAGDIGRMAMRLLREEDLRSKQKQAFDRIRGALRVKEDMPAAKIAAKAILERAGQNGHNGAKKAA